MKYSNIVPLHETKLFPPKALVIALLKLNQCELGTSPLAMVINEVALDSDANKS